MYIGDDSARRFLNAARYTLIVIRARFIRALLPLLSVAAISSLAACEKPLLSPDEPRSQFDRYDAVRSQYAPQYVYDEWGKRKPNLRARLMPKE
jgi:hypothetical protein